MSNYILFSQMIYSAVKSVTDYILSKIAGLTEPRAHVDMFDRLVNIARTSNSTDHIDKSVR